MERLSPTSTAKRHVILDALRGFALLGICMANYPEFSLYTFQSEEAAAAMPGAWVDRVLHYLLYVFVDGKFYTLFSLLFGIGFSIIMENAARKGADGLRIFFRRMAILVVIGFLHLMFIWSGDILMLYALLGMFLPLFRHMSDKSLLGTAAFFLALPVAVDALAAGAGIRLSAPAVHAQWRYCGLYGITEENFGYWLRDAPSYAEVFQFLIQGAFVRIQEFVDGNRYFKVFGLFLLGFYIGRHRIYARLEEHRHLLAAVTKYGFCIGLPLSLAYAWSSMNGHPWGGVIHTAIYTVSVYPMGMAYMCGICLLYLRWQKAGIWHFLALPGRMALTNYIGQSVIGMFLFYGIGLGWGANVSLAQTELVALTVYALQAWSGRVWLSACRFGPLEWIWRMLTYGKLFPLRKEQQASKLPGT